MPEKRLYLVAGLGNPGPNYERTRHNAGFMVIDELADQHRISVQRSKFNVIYGRGTIKGVETILAKPQAYMNRSGPPIRQLADYFRIPCEAVIVVHDDIDLVFERLKIKEKGGDGGHKGIRSLVQAFGGGEFARLRVGVGRSQTRADVVDHVLGPFSRDELSKLDEILRKCAEAIATILSKGTQEGMNRYNRNPR